MGLDEYLCIKTQRTIRNDYTVGYNSKLYQVTSVTKAKKITVEERISGRVVIREDSGRLLECIEIKSRSTKQTETKTTKIKKRYLPPMSHPYKRYLKKGKEQLQLVN